MSELALTNATFPALPARRPYGARGWAAIVRFFTATEEEPERKLHPVYSRRAHYIEDAAMRRAMERL